MVYTQIQNKVFGTGSQTDLTRGFIVSSVVQASIPVTLVGTAFSPPPMPVFASWHFRRKKINTGRAGAQLFVGIWVQHGLSQRNVTRIVAFN